jgi:hypothetical protein
MSTDIDDRLSETAQEEWDQLTPKAQQDVLIRLEILIAEAPHIGDDLRDGSEEDS